MKKITKNDEGLVAAMCQAIIEDSQDILSQLETIDACCLPVWWTSKLAVSSAYINSLRDFITYNTDELETEEAEEESGETETETEELVDNPVEATVEIPEIEEEDDSMLPPSVRMMKHATQEG